MRDTVEGKGIKATIWDNVLECSDLYTDQTMKVGAKWSSIGECGPMECKFINLPRARNERFAIALKVE